MDDERSMLSMGKVWNETRPREGVNPKERRERVPGPALQEGIPWVKVSRKVQVLQEEKPVDVLSLPKTASVHKVNV